MEKVYLKINDVSPYVECDFGIAWKMLYLGPFYALKKKDTKFFSIILLLHISLIVLLFVLVPYPTNIIVILITLLLSNLLFAFNYNMIVIEYLLKEGYYAMDTLSAEKLRKKGIYFKLQ